MVSWMTLWLASEHVGRSFAHEREGIIDGGLSDAEVREYITKVAAPESPLAQRVAMLPKRNLFWKKQNTNLYCECEDSAFQSLWLEHFQNEVIIER